ncbi:alcohol dehydrogenase, propanol-preferring [Actinopolyspora mzabensis]|uniref:alcohol dehydrogenase n=1 Tax=Actinopolyspora mzabensis TaxID=995066 RepID=A0A1G8Y876_ACTMZ|nr:alcohol dehydrogenase catalytic domain-containing protein [Actinopolyspora mzabensis]SDJ98290.1 alcohol dehydrogenase, propanol-preferring [Actinopolyspora mzabensis]
MKAAVISQMGGPWQLSEVPTPHPGPEDVLIRVHACGLCGNDVLATNGILPFPSIEPAITGHEPVGEIVEVGSAVTERAVGDLVGATWIRGTCGDCGYCQARPPLTATAAFRCAAPVSTGFTVQGGHAEYMVAAASETVSIPDGLSPELAAPLLCGGYTAISALRASEPRRDERVAVLGIGGMGHLAVQFSRAAALETVAVTSSEEKHKPARELGADLVVASGPELREVGGADVILVTGSSYRSATDSLPALRENGRMVLAGIDPATPFTIPPEHPFFGLGQRIIGATHHGEHHLRDALDMAASGTIRPMVETFPKERVSEAVDKTARGDVRFRAVVTY